MKGFPFFIDSQSTQAYTWNDKLRLLVKVPFQGKNMAQLNCELSSPSTNFVKQSKEK